MPGDPKECRQHALECIELAHRAKTQGHKKLLTDLAQTWLNLAIELERTIALLDDEDTPAQARPGKH